MLKRIMILLSLNSGLIVTRGFPDSGNPIMITPQIEVQESTRSCSVQVLESLGKQISSAVIDLDACPNAWTKVVVQLTHQEAGVQYDRYPPLLSPVLSCLSYLLKFHNRYGSLWLGLIEVLRTTTPEPVSEGISWVVTKDITSYKDYILNNPGILATLYIPNNVSPKYTGVIYASVSLTFYYETENVRSKSFNEVPRVFPLSLVAQWTTLVGFDNITYITNSLSSSTTDLYLEVYASNHGCEEFYYSNVPDEYSAALGTCGGGKTSLHFLVILLLLQKCVTDIPTFLLF